MKKACIVGASGKLGQYMVRHVLDRGYEVVGVCRERSACALHSLAVHEGNAGLFLLDTGWRLQMSTVNVNGAKYYFVGHGGNGETVVFSHGLLFDRRMFDGQIRVLSPHCRCVAFDWRGHGASETTRSGYAMDSLDAAAATFIAALGLAACHFIGLSMHRYAGFCLAIRRPELLRSLILMSAPAEKDVNFPPDEARRMTAGIPNAELVIIPHAGHYSAIKQPEDVARAIAGFPNRAVSASVYQETFFGTGG